MQADRERPRTTPPALAHGDSAGAAIRLAKELSAVSTLLMESQFSHPLTAGEAA